MGKFFIYFICYPMMLVISVWLFKSCKEIIKEAFKK